MKLSVMKFIFLILSVTVFTTLEADLLMEVRPTNIIVGFTRQLSINCSFIRTDITNMVKLVSLVISRSNDTENLQFSYLASVDVFDNLNNVTGDVSGIIDNRHVSYVALTWHNPRSTLARTYNCEANGENLHGQAVTITKTVEVVATKPDVENLLDVLEQQSDILQRQSSFLEHQSLQLLKLQDDLSRLSLSVNDKCICCDRFNKSLPAMYHISDVHNGRRYYLSPASFPIVVKEAERQCELMGGYLTEMDSQDEYLFVKNFSKKFTGYDFIYIGGNDDALENNWVNTYSGTPVKYIIWGPQEPSSLRGENCLLLWGNQDWTMADNVCVHGDAQYTRGYLCEVPEIK